MARRKKEDELEIDVKEKDWDLELRLLDMEKKENSYLDIIATFIREKPLHVENSKQLTNAISRHARAAQKIENAYSTGKIYEAIQRIKDDNAARERRDQETVDWTLDTVLKYLTK